MGIFVLIILLLPFLVAYIAYCKQQKITNNTVLAFTGGLGCGKTYMAVNKAIKAYKKQRLKYLLSIITFRLYKANKPYLFSNIPVRIRAKGRFLFFFKTAERWSNIITREHLLLKDRLPENAVVLIDEIGQIASQYDFDNPFVMQQLQEFIRFFRHYINGRLILTDQSSSNIVVPIRRRINVIYCLNNFRRYFKIMPFYKVDVSVLEVTEESIVNENMLQTSEKGLIFSKKQLKPFFFGYLPYKFRKKKKLYDSRCYSINYKAVKGKKYEHWKKFKTDYIISIEASGEQRKQYQKNRERLDVE